MNKVQSNGTENYTGVKAPSLALELENGRMVVDLSPIVTRQAVVVDYELFKLLISRIPKDTTESIRNSFIDKLNACYTMAEYRALLAEEFIFHSTIELHNSTDVYKVVKEQEDAEIAMAEMIQQS